MEDVFEHPATPFYCLIQDSEITFFKLGEKVLDPGDFRPRSPDATFQGRPVVVIRKRVGFGWLAGLSILPSIRNCIGFDRLDIPHRLVKGCRPVTFVTRSESSVRRERPVARGGNRRARDETSSDGLRHLSDVKARRTRFTSIPADHPLRCGVLRVGDEAQGHQIPIHTVGAFDRDGSETIGLCLEDGQNRHYIPAFPTVTHPEDGSRIGTARYHRHEPDRCIPVQNDHRARRTRFLHRHRAHAQEEPRFGEVPAFKPPDCSEGVIQIQ